MQNKSFLLKTREYICRFLVIGICFLFAAPATQALQISEIHFDPDGSDTDREWIEVYNDGLSVIDLTEVKFFEANVNHGIDIFNQPNSTEKNIAGGEYAVVVQNIDKFKADFPTYSGKIFKASFSLSNTGETLALKDKSGNILYSITYTESDKQAVPSPGQVNSGGTTSTNNNSNTDSSTTNATTTTSTSTSNNSSDQNTNGIINYFYKSYWPETEKIYVKAGENKVVMQGQEIVFSPKVLDGNKKEIKSTGGSVQFRWNFGDGYTSDKREGLHAYKFVGEFVAVLQVNYNGYVDEDKMYVKVVEPRVNIKIVEKIMDGQSVDILEIENNNNFELDLGNLQLINETGKKFLLPEKTVVLGNKSILLGPDLTGFASSTEKVTISLLSGKILSKFEKVLVQASTTLPVATSSSPHLGEVRRGFTKQVSKVVPQNKPETPKIIKPENKIEEIKVVQNSNRIEFKNEPTFSFFDQLKKIWGI